jgi:hypothetical protein
MRLWQVVELYRNHYRELVESTPGGFQTKPDEVPGTAPYGQQKLAWWICMRVSYAPKPLKTHRGRATGFHGGVFRAGRISDHYETDCD